MMMRTCFPRKIAGGHGGEPDGRKQTALSVPRYDFNWQMQYV